LYDKEKNSQNRTDIIIDRIIFDFRTYTKYIVTIQYNKYNCHVWHMLHRDNSYACLLEIITVYVYLFKEITKYKQTRTHKHL